MFRRLFPWSNRPTPVSYRSTQETKPVWEIPGDYTNCPTQNIHDTVTEFTQDGLFTSDEAPQHIKVTERMVDEQRYHGPTEWIISHSTHLEVLSKEKTYRAVRRDDKSVVILGDRYSDDLTLVDRSGNKDDCIGNAHRYFSIIG